MSKDRLKRKFGARKSTRQMYADRRENQPISLDGVRLDGGTQPREAFDEAVLAEYAERMELDDRGFIVDPSGQDWDPIVVYDDDDQLWLADGFHRVRAARSRGINAFQARVIVGNLRDAIKFSLSANAKHGLRRTNADKRRAVERALQDSEWGAFSARALAELCAVSDYMVRQTRSQLEDSGEIETSTKRVGADGKVHDVSTRTSTSPKKAKRSPKKSTKRGVSLARPEKLPSKLGAQSLALGKLDSSEGLQPADCVIAFPTSLVHFDALADHLHRLIRPDGALIIPVPRNRQGLSGIARLDKLIDKGLLPEPRWVILQDPKLVAVAWTPSSIELPEWTRSLDDLISAIEPASTHILR